MKQMIGCSGAIYATLGLAQCAGAAEYMDEIVVPEDYDAFYSDWHFAPTARSGEFVFVAGIVGFEKGAKRVLPDPEQQIRAAFDSLRELLAASDARLEDVVDLTTFHAPGSDRGLFARVKNEYMKGPAYPAWTAVTVHELAFGAVVEIKAVAIRGWNPRIRREAAPR